jgi:ornithine cyclodeaminase
VGRADASDITLFDSVGFALEDFSALRYLNERALDLGLGQRIGLIPHLADPRDLYGTIGHSTRDSAVVRPRTPSHV